MMAELGAIVARDVKRKLGVLTLAELTKCIAECLAEPGCHSEKIAKRIVAHFRGRMGGCTCVCHVQLIALEEELWPSDCLVPPAVPEELPLRCVFRDGTIQIDVGVNVLRFAAENHPDFGDEGSTTPRIAIVHLSKFAEEVTQAINQEAEDGSTLLSRMLDRAIAEAVGDGCEGVDHGD